MEPIELLRNWRLAKIWAFMCLRSREYLVKTTVNDSCIRNYGFHLSGYPQKFREAMELYEKWCLNKRLREVGIACLKTHKVFVVQVEKCYKFNMEPARLSQ